MMIFCVIVFRSIVKTTCSRFYVRVDLFIFYKTRLPAPRKVSSHTDITLLVS